MFHVFFLIESLAVNAYYKNGPWRMTIRSCPLLSINMLLWRLVRGKGDIDPIISCLPKIIRSYAGRAHNVMVRLKRRARQSETPTFMDVYQQKTGSRALEESE